MALKKKILLKWTAGATAVGGMGGGGFWFREDLAKLLGIKSSSGDGENGGEVNPQRPEESVDEQGIPRRCTAGTPCDITAEDLKGIKFSALGDGQSAVNVSPSPLSSKLFLTIAMEGETKTYTFKNEGDAVTVSKGAASVVLKGAGETKFILENGGLRELIDYGIPKSCTPQVECQLTEEELGKIRFERLEGQGGAATVSNYPSEKSLTLRIEGDKYIFNNKSPKDIKVHKGTKTLTLRKHSESEFGTREGGLGRILGAFGLPKKCITEGNCSIYSEDLEYMKFSGFESGISTVSGLEGDRSLDLSIESTIPESNRKKYIFKNGGDGVTITSGTSTLTLGSGETRFTEENGALKKVEFNGFGLNRDCEANSPCTIYLADLKEIKFEEHGNETAEATVSGYTSQTVTLKIATTSSGSKKYVFNNSGDQITVTRGSRAVTLRANGETKFTEENNLLRKLELGDYGLPKNCSSSNTCVLKPDDLEEVKFGGFEQGSEDVVVTNYGSNQITLTIRDEEEGKKYIFNNSGDRVTVQKGSREVVLKANADTRFLAENGALATLEIGEYGLPGKCATSGHCKLAEDDLKEVKFSGFGDDQSTVTGLASGVKMDLRIINDSSNQRRYIFFNGQSTPINIVNGGQSLSLPKGKTRFTGEDGRLKKLTVGEYGLPQDCSSGCTMVSDDLEQIKFQPLGTGDEEITVTGLAEGAKISLKVDSTVQNKKRYIFSNETPNAIEIRRGTKGNKKQTLRANGKTIFTPENNGELKEMDLDSYGLPKECSTQGTCNLTSDDLETIKFEVLGSEDAPTKVTPDNLSGHIISLVIEGGSDKNNKKYVFTNSTQSEIKLERGSNGSLTFGTNGHVKFSEEGGKLRRLTPGNYGLPQSCTAGAECHLTESDLKDIKFSGLDGEIIVEGLSRQQSISLKIGGSTNSKYVFGNSTGSRATIKNSSSEEGKITLENSTKTKFIVEEGKLKRLDLGEYGLPKTCSSGCSLTAEDLEEIQFEELGGESDGEITVSPTNQNITLKIENINNSPDNRKYIFSNDSEQTVTIKRGSSKSIILPAHSKTRFASNDDKSKLKKIVLGNYGLPSLCIANKNCTLTEDDLEQIKFEELGDGGKIRIENYPPAGNITLTIDESDQNNGKYLFENTSSSPVVIKVEGSQDRTVSLRAKGKTRFIVSGDKLKREAVGNFGLPKGCLDNRRCDLSEDDLEDIKFEVHGDEGGESTVTNYPQNQNITLTIDDNDQTSKRYIFTNGSNNAVEIERNNQKVILPTGKTKFTEGDDGKLKERKLGKFGLPQECLDSKESQCVLNADDLGDIKFKDFENEVDGATVTPNNKTVTLRIINGSTNQKRYVFENSGENQITIRRGSKSMVLKTKVRSRFTEDGDHLKTLELGDYGLPKECKENKKCDLTKDDLERIKFSGFSDEEDSAVANLSDGKTISLRIDDGDNERKRYIFSNETDQDIQITNSSTTVTLEAGKKTKFTEDNGNLSEIKLNSYGLPTICTSDNDCSLIADELEEAKFDGFESRTGKVSVTEYGSGQKITLKIGGSKGNKYIFNNDSDQRIEIKKEDRTITLTGSSKTRFLSEDNRLKELSLNDLGLPKTCVASCSLKVEDLEEIKFKDLGEESDGEVTVSPTNQNVFLKIENINGSEDKKKYIFSNESNQPITIKRGSGNNNSITLEASSKTRFTEENNKLKKLVPGNFGLPSECAEGKSCTLTEDDLEQIKFTQLDSAEGKVTVTPYDPNQSITLKIDNTSSTKKYIFTNASSKNIDIGRGNATVTLKAQSKTRFTEDGDKLKPIELDNYGIPTSCNTSGSCTLYADDLEDIKFVALDGGSGMISTTNLDSSKFITLKIDSSNPNNKKYVFKNEGNSEVTVQKGGKKVSLGKGKTKFIVSGDKLEKLILGDYGLPKSCDSSSQCTLKEDDLKEIMFEELGEDGDDDVTVSNLPSEGTITFTKDSSDSSNVKYVFKNSNSSEIQIKKGTSKTVSLKAQGKTKFTVSGGKLKKAQLGNYGLPSECSTTNSCALKDYDLESIEFEDFKDQSGEVTVNNLSSSSVSLSIEEINGSSDGKKKYVFRNGAGQSVTIQKGSKSVTLEDGKTKFMVEGGKLKALELGDYGLPKNFSSGNSLKDEDLEEILFSALGDENEDGRVTVTPTNQSITLKIDSTDSTRKKYIFTNGSSSPVIIQKGNSQEKKITLKASGKTKFIEDDGNLKEVSMDYFGLPETCKVTAGDSNPKTCTLTSDDLEDIKFDGLDIGTGEIAVAPSSKTLTLNIDISDSSNHRYIFTNSSGSEIKIQKGSESSGAIAFKNNESTRFTAENNKLKKVELGQYGIPKSCHGDSAESSGSKSCTLIAEDLKDIKYEDLEGESRENVTITPSHFQNSKTITLMIEGEDNNKTYSFLNKTGSEIKIKASDDNYVILDSTGNNKFTVVGEKLRKERAPGLGSYGLPLECKLSDVETKKTCKLTNEDLKTVKFVELSGGEEEEETEPKIIPSKEDKKLLLKIDESDSNNKKYSFKNNSSSDIKIQNGNDSSRFITLKANSETEFTGDEASDKLKRKKSEMANERMVALKLPEGCKLTDGDTSKECDVDESALKNVEFEGKEDGQELNISGLSGGSSSLKLTTKLLDPDKDKDRYGENIREGDVRFSFKDFTSQVTIGPNGSSDKDIVLVPGAEQEFIFNSEGKLGLSFKAPNDLGEKVGLSCTKQSDTTTCSPKEANGDIRVHDSGSSSIKKLKPTDTTSPIFTVEEKSQNFNQGFKFKVTTAPTTSDDSGVQLEENGEYEIKYFEDGSDSEKGWALAKKDAGK